MIMNTYQNEDEFNIQNFSRLRDMAIEKQNSKFNNTPILIYQIMQKNINQLIDNNLNNINSDEHNLD